MRVDSRTGTPEARSRRRGVGVDRGGDRGEHGDRLGRLGRRRQEGGTVGVVAVVLGDQVDGERDRAGARVVGEGKQHLGEQRLGVAARPPDVQRVARFEARVEYRGEPPPGLRGERRERDADRGRQVGDVGALEAGVVHGGQPLATGRGFPPVRVIGVPGHASGAARAPDEAEQFQGVREFRQVTDAVHAVAPRPAPARRRRPPPGRRSGRRPGSGSPPTCPAGSRNTGTSRAAASASTDAQRRRVPDRLQNEREDLRLRQGQRVPGVGRGGRDELLPGGDGEREAERAPGPQQRGEHRPRVRDQRDRPGRQRVGLGVADRAQPARHVHEPHAPGPAHGHPRVPRDRRDPLPQPRPGPRAVRVHGGAEDHRRTGAASRRRPHLLLERGVGNGEQRQVDRLRKISKARVARARRRSRRTAGLTR